MGKEAKLNKERLALTRSIEFSGAERCILAAIGNGPPPKSFNDVEAQAELWDALKLREAKMDDKPRKFALTVEKLRLLDSLMTEAIKAGVWSGNGAMTVLPARKRIRDAEKD